MPRQVHERATDTGVLEAVVRTIGHSRFRIFSTTGLACAGTARGESTRNHTQENSHPVALRRSGYLD